MPRYQGDRCWPSGSCLRRATHRQTLGERTLLVYPDARYAPFTVYSSSELPFTSNGVASSLADFQIAPDPGSANPWRQVAASGGNFTLKLRMQVSPGQDNVLPLTPAGVTSGVGYLEYRVYLPASGDALHIALPHITVENRGSTQQLRACTSHTTVIPPPVRSATCDPCPLRCPASVTLSRTAAPAISAPALPVRLTREPAGRRAGAQGCTPDSAAHVKPDDAASAARPWPSVETPTVHTDRPNCAH